MFFFFIFQFNMNRSTFILKYLKRKQPEKGNSRGSGVGLNINECQRDGENEGESIIHSKTGDIEPSRGQSYRGSEFDLSTLPMDPGLRKMISEYPPNLQDGTRRYYIANGPIQPRTHKFPQKLNGGRLRRFNHSWFDKYETWLEYGIHKDAAFCLCCYLFANVRENQSGDFIRMWFATWNKLDSFDNHVGDSNSVHNKTLRDNENLRRPRQSIEVALDRHDEEIRKKYRLCLNTSISCSRYLLCQGLPFRGHDESEESENRGNFLELVKFAANLNELIASIVLDSAPKSEKLVSNFIQKDIVRATAKETLKAILEEFKDDVFGLLVDKSGGLSHKEQMGVVLCFVNKMGIVKERFVGVVHV